MARLISAPMNTKVLNPLSVCCKSLYTSTMSHRTVPLERYILSYLSQSSQGRIASPFASFARVTSGEPGPSSSKISIKCCPGKPCDYFIIPGGYANQLKYRKYLSRCVNSVNLTRFLSFILINNNFSFFAIMLMSIPSLFDVKIAALF